MSEAKENSDSWSESDEGSVDDGQDNKGGNTGRWTKEVIFKLMIYQFVNN